MFTCAFLNFLWQIKEIPYALSRSNVQKEEDASELLSEAKAGLLFLFGGQI